MDSTVKLEPATAMPSLRLRTLSIAPNAYAHGSGLPFAGLVDDDATGLHPRGAPV